MKNKFSFYLIAVAMGILLGIGVIRIESLFMIESKESSSLYNSEIYIIVKSKTITELVNETSREVYKGPGPSTGKIAYITIDDGPTKYTNQILDILNENNIKATFFLIDSNMKKRPEVVKRIVKNGHGVGFHSVSHDRKILYSSPENTLNEFNTCKETFSNITGKESNLVRLPYGSKPYAPKESIDILLKNNYLIWDWNLDTEDWRGSSDNIVSNILYYGRDKSKLIVLMHEKEQTIEALESTIKVLKERGYTILPITEEVQSYNYWNKNMQ